MEIITYSKESIEKLLNIINTLPYQGFQSASKIVEIYNILNNPIKEKSKQEIKQIETES
jgi:recombinational DNA repair protein RecR